MVDVVRVLGTYFCDKYSIDVTEDYSVEWVDAKELIVPNRIDLMAKVSYVNAYVSGIGYEWAKELYIKHIEAFSHGREPGNKNKNTVSDYLTVFNSLIEEIADTGFDCEVSVVPVGKNNSIMDGAHRTAIAIALDKKLPIIRLPQLYPKNDFKSFQEALLDPIYLDYMMLQYLKWDPHAHCACIWHRANDPEKLAKMEELMEQEGQIAYKKELKLNYNGIRNLMIQIYSGFEWMGGIDTHFSGASGKADVCFQNNSSMYLYVIKMDTLEHTLDLKSKIRDIFQIGNHSIHISDTQAEAIQIGQMLLNDNSIHYLNYGKPDRDISFLKGILSFVENKSAEGYCLDDIGMSWENSLAMYGIGNASAIAWNINEKAVSVNIADSAGYNASVDTLYSPRDYFQYAGLKFCSLDYVLKNKALNADTREKLVQLTASDKSRKSHWNEKKDDLRRGYRNLRHYVRDWLSERGLIEIPMKIYHLIVRRK